MPVSVSDERRKRKKRCLRNRKTTIVCEEEATGGPSTSGCGVTCLAGEGCPTCDSPILALEPHMTSDGEHSRSSNDPNCSDASTSNQSMYSAIVCSVSSGLLINRSCVPHVMFGYRESKQLPVFVLS